MSASSPTRSGCCRRSPRHSARGYRRIHATVSQARHQRGSRAMIEERFDAIVVGAGMAGNAAALTMAQRGMKVLQLERGEYSGSKNVQGAIRSEEHTSELQSPDHLVCRLLLE